MIKKFLPVSITAVCTMRELTARPQNVIVNVRVTVMPIMDINLYVSQNSVEKLFFDTISKGNQILYLIYI